MRARESRLTRQAQRLRPRVARASRASSLQTGDNTAPTRTDNRFPRSPSRFSAAARASAPTTQASASGWQSSRASPEHTTEPSPWPPEPPAGSASRWSYPPRHRTPVGDDQGVEHRRGCSRSSFGHDCRVLGRSASRRSSGATATTGTRVCPLEPDRSTERPGFAVMKLVVHLKDFGWATDSTALPGQLDDVAALNDEGGFDVSPSPTTSGPGVSLEAPCNARTLPATRRPGPGPGARGRGCRRRCRRGRPC
jgi:hypothetical protein